MPGIPDVDRATLEHALERFDREYRDQAEWTGWEERESHKFAIEHNGRRYPVKQVISLATDYPVSRFSGGLEANSYVSRRGFKVVQLRPDDGHPGGDGDREAWDEFVSWAKRFYEDPSFDTKERQYKMVVSQNVQRARESCVAGHDDWHRLLKKAFGPPNNLTSWRVHDRFLKWCTDNTDAARNALLQIWSAPTPATEKIDAFVAALPADLQKGGVASLVSVLLFGVDPENCPPFRRTLFEKAFELTHYAPFAKGAAPRVLYEYALAFLDRLIAEGASRDLHLPNRIDAQGAVWAVLNAKVENLPSTWTAGEKKALIRYRGESPEPQAWIFQANPQLFDLDGALKTLSELTWTVRQHQAEIHAGHGVFLWESGPDAGVVAVGTILNDPIEMEEDPESVPFNRDQTEFAGLQTRVRLRVDRVLPEPIRRDSMMEDPVLNQLRIIKSPQGTNFPLTEEQEVALRARLNGTPTVRDIMAYLRTEKLHFPEEVVSNYLLSLQTKRFVILTGISGTGKTQLALAVAKYFRPAIAGSLLPRVDVPNSAVEIEVRPHMLSKNRISVPPQIVATLGPLVPNEGTEDRSQIEVEYPGGSGTFAFRRSPDGDGASLLYMKGALRDWFRATLKVGDRFFIQVADPDTENPSALRLTVPVGAQRREVPATCCTVAVRPDWTDNRGLVGYFNPLTNRYVDAPVLRLLLRADEDVKAASREKRPAYPFFVILDEMNLAHVEQYFSDFLSCLESGEPIELHSNGTAEAGDGESIPNQLRIPANVFFTGTVNVDETTYMFSPKVLDRAFTIELHDVDLEGYGQPGQPALISTPLRLTRLPDSFEAAEKPTIEDWTEFGSILDGDLRGVVVELNTLLTEYNRQFGYRVANEIAKFVLLAAQQASDADETLWAALDLALLEKVLPKFHGTQEEMDDVLRALFLFADAGTSAQSASNRLWDQMQTQWHLEDGRVVQTTEGDAAPRFPRTATKLWMMLTRLHRQGFTSYIG